MTRAQAPATGPLPPDRSWRLSLPSRIFIIVLFLLVLFHGSDVANGQSASTTGKVIAVRENAVSINIGVSSGVKPGMRLTVSRGALFGGYLVVREASATEASGVIVSPQFKVHVDDVVSLPSSEKQPKIMPKGLADDKDRTKNPVILLDVYTDPSPAIHGGDFSLVFIWSRAPESARIRIFNPSGELKYEKLRAKPGEETFSTKLYSRHLTERGWYKVEVSQYRDGAKDVKASFLFALLDKKAARGARWEYTLSQPSTAQVYFREKVTVRIKGFPEKKMPVNVWLVCEDGRHHHIGRAKTDSEGVYAEFDSWVYQRFVTTAGEYRLRIQPVLAGKKYANRFSEPFKYFPYPRDDAYPRELYVGNRRFVYVNAVEHGGKAGEFCYYTQTKDGQLVYFKYFSELAAALSKFADKSSQHFVYLSYPLQQGESTYQTFALTTKQASAEPLPRGRAFWLSEASFRKAGLTKVILLDEKHKPVADKQLAVRLFRASAVGYYARNVKKTQLGIDPAYVAYVKRLTEDPVVVGAFAVQGATSYLQDLASGGSAWPIRYRYVFLDMMTVGADSTGLTPKQREAITAALRAGGSANRVAALLGPLAEKLPSGYIKKLDHNWNLVLRGKQYHFMRRRTGDSAKLGLVLSAARMLTEFTNVQVVMRDRAEQIRAFLPALKGKVDSQMLLGLTDALAKADKMYVYGFESALDKLVKLAVDKGVDAATAALAKASSKAHMVLLAFEINNLIFNMDGMYERALKAQCAAGISTQFKHVSTTLENKVHMRGRSSIDLAVLEQLDCLYRWRLLSLAEFHRYLREFIDVSGVGKELGNAITQGKVYRDLKTISRIESDSKQAASAWEQMPGIATACERLQTPAAGQKKKEEEPDE